MQFHKQSQLSVLHSLNIKKEIQHKTLQIKMLISKENGEKNRNSEDIHVKQIVMSV